MPQALSRRALFRRAAPADLPAPHLPRVAAVSGACLAAQGVTCASCVDPCEIRALKIRPMLGGRGLLTIDTAACTGCGDCLKFCPVGALSLAAAERRETQPCV